MESKLFVLCGMIASGKSTYTRNAAKQGYLIVNDDSIVNLLHADQYHLYDKSLKVLYKSVENHIIGMAISMKKNIIVDRGLNGSKNGRKRLIALANSFDVQCEAIVFHNEGPEIHAKRRAESDSRGLDYNYWLKVAQVHHANWQHPSCDEGFVKITTLPFSKVKEGFVL